MSRSAGPGSPVAFNCWQARRYSRSGGRGGHSTELTGRTRPYRRRGVTGVRSVHTSYEYRCSCGYLGWSNHIDLAYRAGDDEALRKVGRRR